METKAAKLLTLTHCIKHSVVLSICAALNVKGAMKEVQVQSHRTEKRCGMNREWRKTPQIRKRKSMQLRGSAKAANQQPIKTSR